jgi:hypothetical protein
LTAALAVPCLLASCAPAFARPFQLGFFDDVVFGDAATRGTWIDRTVDAGGGVVRITPPWALIAPSRRPSGFDPADPADPAYRWTAVDALVRDLTSRGVAVLFTINGAPTWAEGAHRPSGANPGSWRPQPGELAAFARAAAQRYSGSFVDPADPSRTLPRIRRWQIWNETNITTYLAPQWIRRHGHLVLASPQHYRAMLNAAYGAIKAVQSDAIVSTAGTAPYGDLERGGSRIPPVTFTRALLCLRPRGRLAAVHCAHPAHLDALAHHPYGVRGPESHALNRDDVAVPDIGKLARVLRFARRKHRVLPNARKRLWVTEIGWDSRPPDPHGVPARRHSRWVAQALYVLWRQRVELVTWLRIRDQDASAGYASSNQSGMYFYDGRPKRSLAAFRFPFVADTRRSVVWGRAPASGPVVIERLTGSRWRTVGRTSTSGDHVFQRRLHVAQGRYRAVQDASVSPTWRVR